jgi:hypothetical protein
MWFDDNVKAILYAVNIPCVLLIAHGTFSSLSLNIHQQKEEVKETIRESNIDAKWSDNQENSVITTPPSASAAPPNGAIPESTDTLPWPVDEVSERKEATERARIHQGNWWNLEYGGGNGPLGVKIRPFRTNFHVVSTSPSSTVFSGGTRENRWNKNQFNGHVNLTASRYHRPTSVF